MRVSPGTLARGLGIYPFYEAWARELADRTRNGRFVEVEAPHTIFEGHLPEVMVELNGLLDDVR